MINVGKERRESHRSQIQLSWGAAFNAILFLGVSLSPVYLWGSGGMQLSHLLLSVLCLGYVLRRGVGLARADAVLLLLALWVVLRESIALVEHSDLQSVISALHVVYCLVLFNVLRRCFEKYGVKALACGLWLASAIAFVSIVMGGALGLAGWGGRAIGLFNNPNQLGYFAVCLTAIACALKLRASIGTSSWIGFLFLGAYFAAVSLSSAALLSVGSSLIWVGLVGSPPKVRIVTGVVALILLVLGSWLFLGSTELGGEIIAKISATGAAEDDSLHGRGYLVWSQASALELAFGLSYVGVLQVHGLEIHSTIFSFFGSYGLVGGTIFVGFLWLFVVRVWRLSGLKGLVLIVLPPMLYGLTHNGSRFLLFWILLAVCFSWGEGSRRENGVSA